MYLLLLEYDVFFGLWCPPLRFRPRPPRPEVLLDVDGRETLRLRPLWSLPCGDDALDADGVLNWESD